MGFVLKEHASGHILWGENIITDSFDSETLSLSLTSESSLRYQGLKSKAFRSGQYCYEISHIKEESKISVHPGYFIGVDWLITGERYIQVEPKINRKISSYFNKQSALDEEDFKAAKSIEEEAEGELANERDSHVEINCLKMLLDTMSDDALAGNCADLIKIDWEARRIPIYQQQDQLTPFLIVQYLQLLRRIVRKGLKKSYYKIQENLNNRIKGKILVGAQIKQNLLKNRQTKTYCSYQEFGEDNIENRFLKKVLSFVGSYVENNEGLFSNNSASIAHLVSYSRPAFEHVGNDIAEEQLRHLKHNPFFKEYKEAISIGYYILKRFSYNITSTTHKDVDTPPFWIDMPRLFELYVYQKLLHANGYDRNKIQYQFSTYGNALDILVKDGENSMIIDAKYKLHYSHSHVHQDIRQVAGYARLNRVRKELDISDDRNIDCLIIYPDMGGVDLENADILVEKFSISAIREAFKNENSQIPAYHKVYKVGVKLPTIQSYII